MFVDTYPAGFNADEYSQGYTAYSILKTGRDEWGVKLPVTPRAYGDFRSPLYTYLTIPSIFVFGLNEFSVRFPSVVIGTLAIFAAYLLVKKIFNDPLLAGTSSLLIALSPWNIYLSRGAFEANITILLLSLGMYFFICALKKNNSVINYVLSSLVFGLNIFSYYSPRFITPIVAVILIIFFRKEFFKSRGKYVFLAIFGFFVLISFFTLFKGAKTRVTDTSILNQGKNWDALSVKQYTAVYLGLPRMIERVFNNKLSFLINQFVSNYLGYFSFEFWFSKGPSEATYGMMPGRGLLYLFELPLIIYSIWTGIKNKDKNYLLLLAILLVSPLGAAMAKGERAANRSSTMMPFLEIISAYGLVNLYRKYKIQIQKYKLGILFCAIYLVSVLFFLEDYFFQAPTINAQYMSYGWKSAVEFLKQNNNYEKVIISKKYSEPQIAISFYLKLDPIIVQKNSTSWLAYEKQNLLFVDMLPKYKLEKYEFRNFNFPEDQKLKNTLFLGKSDDFAGVEANIKKIIYFPGPENKIAFEIADFENK